MIKEKSEENGNGNEKKLNKKISNQKILNYNKGKKGTIQQKEKK